MKCPKCGSKITKEDAFCPECGSKIDFEKIEKKEKKHEEKEHHHKTTSKKWIKTVSIVGIILVFGAIFIFAVPLPYYPTEVYSVSEPYTDTETYYEEESYQDTECELKYPSYNKEQDFEWAESGKATISCTISNFESEAISLRYTLYSYDEDGDLEDSYGPRSLTVGPGSTVTKDYDLDATYPGTYNCGVEVDQIKECHLATKFKSVPKQKTVTKYKNVDKERKVTRYATLFQKWTGQVNWYFKEGEA